MAVGGQDNAPAALPPGKRPFIHCTEVWEGPRAGLDGFQRSPHNGIRYPDLLDRRESLERLHYPGPHSRGNRPQYPSVEGWVGPRDDLDVGSTCSQAPKPVTTCYTSTVTVQSSGNSTVPVVCVLRLANNFFHYPIPCQPTT